MPPVELYPKLPVSAGADGLCLRRLGRVGQLFRLLRGRSAEPLPAARGGGPERWGLPSARPRADPGMQPIALSRALRADRLPMGRLDGVERLRQVRWREEAGAPCAPAGALRGPPLRGGRLGGGRQLYAQLPRTPLLWLRGLGELEQVLGELRQRRPASRPPLAAVAGCLHGAAVEASAKHAL